VPVNLRKSTGRNCRKFHYTTTGSSSLSTVNNLVNGKLSSARMFAGRLASTFLEGSLPRFKINYLFVARINFPKIDYVSLIGGFRQKGYGPTG